MQEHEPAQPDTRTPRFDWPRIARALPLTLALIAVTGVWLGGAVWSFEEQTRLADRLLFAVPCLLPLVLDGLAISLAGVAYAAALDGRAAVHARVMTALAVAASAASNGAAAAARSGTKPADLLAVTIAAGVPLAANIAFEVLLGELRRQVHRRRGLPAPVAIPHPRAIRLVLAPISTYWEWRTMVLEITDPALTRTQFPATVPDASQDSPPPVLPQVSEDALDAEDSTAAALPVLPQVPPDVLNAGQKIATELAAAGIQLTHRALTEAYRTNVGSIGSDTASALLKHLKAGPLAATTVQDQAVVLTNA